MKSSGATQFAPTCASMPCFVTLPGGHPLPALFHRISRRVSCAANNAAAGSIVSRLERSRNRDLRFDGVVGEGKAESTSAMAA